MEMDIKVIINIGLYNSIYLLNISIYSNLTTQTNFTDL